VGDLVCNGQKGRTLAFERERDIVDSLAFLSAALDNPEKVTAIISKNMQMHAGVLIRGVSMLWKKGFRGSQGS